MPFQAVKICFTESTMNFPVLWNKASHFLYFADMATDETKTQDGTKTGTRKRTKQTKIGGYLPIKKIGQGAMGDIWLCEDPSLCRPVVVKQMLPSLRGYDDLIQRFKRECVLLAALHHPNIVHPYALWQERTGKLALAMEYVDGKTFREILDVQSRPPIWVTLYLVHEILQALICVHANQIIHRDLKPSNMMVEKNGRVRLLDFGIARDANPGQDMTLPGSVLGTAAYMSPEQVKGFTVTYASDIFSLGIIACEMIMGKNPFRGESMELTSQYILNLKLKMNNFPPGTPYRLRRWILKCLEKKPQDRFSSTKEAADALAQIMDGYPRQLDIPMREWLTATMRNEPLPELPKNSRLTIFKIGIGIGAFAGTLLATFITALICR